MPAIAVFDAGTGAAKCTIFDLTGALRGHHSETWSYTVRAHRDVPLVKEYAFDPDEFWGILARCMRAALAQARVDPADVIGAVTTSQREGCVFLAADGRELYAGPNLDSRGFMEGLEILGSLGPERLYAITGHSAPFIFPLARYLWYRKQGGEPAARILMINDWMSFRLCGKATAEPSNASESMLFDFRGRCWSEEILSHFEIPAEILPPIVAAGAAIGTVHAMAAAATGLRAGTPVFAGGADTQCALLGAGAVDVGDTAVILGTTTPVQAVVGEPLLDPVGNLWAGCHVVPERWVIESNGGSTGDAYLWLLELLVGAGEDRYARAEALAAAAQDGAAFTFVGPRIFDLTRIRPDMPGGILFPFPTLQLRPTAGELLRAFLSSIAYAVRANIEQLTAVTGRRAAEIIIGGGMSRSELLVRFLADVAGLPMRRAVEPQSTGLGCAMLVAVGAGAHADPASAVRAMCRHEVVAADESRRDAVDAGFRKWRELYDSLETHSI
ncbi:MAG TPA: FGGY family carbohydrate kinase [Candidatus Dormibacteraeota bacterium]|nr:FGGY family carbohydrate kinase [Candidatus Dormibacteraeota bacterium]